MVDSGQSQRRQPPSPLVFSPEAAISPIPPPLQYNSSSSTHHGSGSNTVSMPFVRRHVTRRLKAAKAECDKELQRITNNITAFFEDRLRAGDHETERECRDRGRDRDSQIGDYDHLSEPFVLQPADLRSALQAEESSSDGGYEAEVEYGQHGRQRANTDEDGNPPALAHWSSSPGLQASSSTSISPASLRRQHTVPWDRPLSSSVSSSVVGSSPATSTILLPEAPLTRKQSNAANSAPTSWGSQGVSSRRLSRTIHIPTRPTRSAQSSRSTSRSRSPLPPISTHASFSEYGHSAPSSGNRRSSRILVDDPVDPIMTTLYAVISVATDITDMSVAQLTAQPKVCEALVQRVQSIGKVWDEHPDWHGRNWYVQVLLAVASLSRVVEWWEAEKQFWNFDDNDDEQDEPLMFVTKPADEPPPPVTSSTRHTEPTAERTFLDVDDENRSRSSRPGSHGRKSRDEHTKDLYVPNSTHEAEPSAHSPQKPVDNTESARVLATERLRLQAETAQNQNIVLELSLDGDHFIWVNYAWRGVVGSDPEDLAGTRISRLLAPGDETVFREATQRLQDDDSRTVEVRFNLRIEPGDNSSSALYQLMEAKGMLMIDREDGMPSHTMWVVKPIAPPRYELESHPEDVTQKPSETPNTAEPTDQGEDELSSLPFSQPISAEPILCRICESQIPQWYFEKHSETCVEIHRLEAEIAECNESIGELRNTIRDLSTALEKATAANPPDYRGMTIFTPSSSPIVSSPLHLFRSAKMRGVSVKKMQRRLLEQLEDILQTASEISVPSLKEEEAKEPIERQRLLSPSSERKITTVRTWSKPNTEDAALGQLVQDAERVMRQKIDNIVRMQNTIRYSEKIWHEWEQRVERALALADCDSDSDESVEDGEAGGNVPDDGDHSSTTSEYAYTGDLPSTTQPTPLASSSPAPQWTPPETRPPSAPIPAHPVAYNARQSLHTRSSTPSSVSSPLALAAPIVAPSSPEEHPPPMSLDDPPSAPTMKHRRSGQSLLEPRVIITPPASPRVVPKDGLTREPSTKRSHRRHSTAASQIISPPGPLSPRQPSVAPLSRTNPTSIKDFDIIKPISKGAFGSVFLAKKKATGDYYAIKVLKKADMIAKNQITNVKAERMILMKQAESPFVAKLYFTFQSKDNLYLVMEYLNGGDCAALIKSLGSLPEEWTKNYIAEVVLGLEYLHQRGIVHRDLKPDNLLIDQHGHLKLTDFGLSRIGLLGRQTHESQNSRPLTRYNSRSRPPSLDSAYLSSPLIHPDASSGDDVSEFGASDTFGGLLRRGGKTSESPLQSFATELTTDLRSHSHSNSNSNSFSGTPPGEQKFVGTPDYLAPETILGLRGDDAAVDWWALGVITYEFLYGLPPFHADTPEKVFENILSGHIEWHEEWVDFSDEARDFMQRLMTLDPTQRLGAKGAEEVKAHPFLADIDWDKVTTTEAAFIPQVTDPESTDYFDPRGAIPQLFHDDDQVALTNRPGDSPVADTSLPPLAIPIPSRDSNISPSGDDFGSFSFKNVPILKQANDDVIRKLKTDQMAPLTHTLSEPGIHSRKRSVSQRFKKPPSVITATDNSKVMNTGPPSPATSTSSIASSPSRTPSAPGAFGGGHIRKHSEYGAVERFKQSHLEGVDRRNSMPSRLRTASISSSGDISGSENLSSVGNGSAYHDYHTPSSSVHSIDLKKGPDPSDRAVTCLLAEDNPITAKIIETLLIRLGCRCVVVADGSEAISVAMGDIKFDVILMDLQMPVLDGEGAARYIKSTNGRNANTPIIAVSAYSGIDMNEANNVFVASLAKPLQKADLLNVMRQIGFKTTTMQGPGSTKLTASHSPPIAL